MRRLLTAVVAVAVVTGIVTLTPARGPFLDLVAPTPTPAQGDVVHLELPEPPVPGQPLPPREPAPPPSGPKLSAEEAATAVEMIAADPAVARVLGGIGYSVQETVPWTTSGSAEPDIVGADVEIALSTPLSGPVAFPGVRFEPTNTTYQRLVNRAVVHGTSRLSVLVDFRVPGVVSIRPADDARLDELPGNKHFPPRGD